VPQAGLSPLNALAVNILKRTLDSQ
jgi:hypothetical protein